MSSMRLIVFILALSLSGSGGEAAQPAHYLEASRPIQRIVGCLFTEEFVRHDLEQLNLNAGDSAWIRIHSGSIPGLMPTPTTSYIAVYTEDESQGWLLIADRGRKGSFIPVRNAYRLKKEGVRWTADEGNGGLATYKAMTRFATRLAQSSRYRVKLETGNCTANSTP